MSRADLLGERGGPVIPEEQELLRNLLDGYETAFDNFYNQMAPRWLSYLTSERWYYRLSEEEAQDIVQQTMLVIHSKISGFDPNGAASFSTWCYAILIKIAVWRRREKVRLIYFSEIEEEGSVSTGIFNNELDKEPDVTSDEEGFESWLEGDGELQNALRSLKAGEQRLIELKVLEGLTHKEIANRLGKSEAAVRVQFHRLVNRLRSILERTKRNANGKRSLPQ
jgi:RNA polymerase sigma-70 factor (ECF subfamily)